MNEENEISKGVQEGYIFRQEGKEVSAFESPYAFHSSNTDKKIDYYKGLAKKQKSQANTNNYEITDNIHTRTPMSRSDYDYWRPNERIPTNFGDIVSACRAAYKTNGTVRNVINLMVDFAVEDMRILHEDKATETFYKVWANRVNLNDKIEEFARHLLLDGNVVAKRFTAKLTKPAEKEWQKVAASPDLPNIKTRKDSISRREIPINYYFLDVSNLDWIHNEIEHMAGRPQLAIKLTSKSIRKIKHKSTEKQLRELLADDIRKGLEDGNIKESTIPLNMEKLYVAHYKKDSWDKWADPYLVAVLKDLQFKNKLHQADLSALDGVINVIRLWRLGDHKEKMFPNAAIVDRLVDILQTNTGGGALDVVWDSMIDMQEFYPPVDKILGPEKYTQVNKDILFGLGIPEVLLGGEGANFSNSWIQLKTIVEKLEFIRQKIVEWMQEEFDLIARGMGFPKPAKARFGKMDLQDENITKKLIVGLMDRGIVSVETVLKTYGEDYLVEIERISRENQELEKLGIEKHNPLEKQDKEGDPENDGPGRPALTNDDEKRDDRTAKPRTGSYIDSIMALDMVNKVDKFLSKKALELFDIKNMRQMTSAQKADYDKMRVAIISNMKDSDQDIEQLIISSPKTNKNFVYILNEATNKFHEKMSKEPNQDQYKLLLAAAWSDMRSK